MREVTKLLQRWREQFKSMVTRPGMYASGPEGIATLVWYLMFELCFLEAREVEASQKWNRLLSIYGKTGPAGALGMLLQIEHTPPVRMAAAEAVVAVYAEAFHALGHFEVERTMSEKEWRAFERFVRDHVRNKDLRRSELLAAVGPPSAVAGGRSAQVLCFASAHGWAFVDFCDFSTPQYAPGTGDFRYPHDEDPLVFAVRMPAENFERGLNLTLVGRVITRGVGWWIEQSELFDQKAQAIAGQLKEVDAQEPASKPRRLKKRR
jgi:hypothetical protein